MAEASLPKRQPRASETRDPLAPLKAALLRVRGIAAEHAPPLLVGPGRLVGTFQAQFEPREDQHSCAAKQSLGSCFDLAPFITMDYTGAWASMGLVKAPMLKSTQDPSRYQ